jgi:hypothetical protein
MGQQRKRSVPVAKSLPPVNPTMPARLRCLKCDSSKWFESWADFDKHKKTVHPEVTIFIACADFHYFSPAAGHENGEPLTYRPDASARVTAAIEELAKAIGVDSDGFIVAFRPNDSAPIVFTEVGGLDRLPNITIPTLSNRLDYTRQLAVQLKGRRRGLKTVAVLVLCLAFALSTCHLIMADDCWVHDLLGLVVS